MRHALLLVLLVAACGGSSKPKPETPPLAEDTPSNEAPPEPEETAPAEEATGGDALSRLPACSAYIQAAEAYATCPQVDQATRDAIKQGLDAMKQGFGNVDQMEPQVQQQVNDACTQAVDALRQSAAQLGCPI